jgi:dynein heavy chain 2, cytosolic
MSTADFQTMIQQGIVTYEREYKELHMLLFDEILDHIARIDRYF